MILRLEIFLFLFSVTAYAFPSKVAGQWYYIADGLTNSHAYPSLPSWFSQSGNVISLSFMNPADLIRNVDPVPEIFKTSSTQLQRLGKVVFFSIGGYGYAGDWTWLNDPNAAAQAGAKCAAIAKTYNVGIELDYEGGADPLNGITAFIQGFRRTCPMGQCMLSQDLYGSPGGAGWQLGLLPNVLPKNGTPGEYYGNGNYLDFVNVMVIDAQPINIAQTFWQQWINTHILTMTRATFALLAGYPGTTLGICSNQQYSRTNVDEAVNFLSSYNIYGYMSWAICPPAPGSAQSCGDWIVDCNTDASGYHYLCSKVKAC